MEKNGERSIGVIEPIPESFREFPTPGKIRVKNDTARKIIIKFAQG
jgi:hypothetical protein